MKFKMKFKKKIIFKPAFDKRNPDPTKNYGIHGAEMKFYLTSEKAVIQFVVYTQWHLPHVQQELDLKSSRESWMHHPIAADIGYHSPKPMYEGHEPTTLKCHLLQGDCYYDGSSLYADEFLKLLISKGSDAVWRKMKEYYLEHFENQPPEITEDFI